MKPHLLIFELRMMGDAVMSLPFVRAAREKYTVFVCCQPSNVDVFLTHLPRSQIIGWRPPWLETTLAAKWASWRRADFKDFVVRMRATRPQVALGVWGEVRTHILVGLSGAKVRIGLPMNQRNLYGSHLRWRRRQIWLGRVLQMLATLALRTKLLTRKINRGAYLQHHVEDWRQVADTLELTWDTTVPWFQPTPVPLPPAVQEWLTRVRARGQRTWLWHLGARWEGRRWPVGRVKKVVQDFFVRNNIPLLLLRSPDVEMTPELASLSPVFVPANLAELITVLDAADFLVCNDTGVAHLGAALGKRVISIFSAGMPAWIAPFGNADYVIRKSVCPYHPCLDRCFQPSYICREAVTEEMVLHHIARESATAA